MPPIRRAARHRADFAPSEAGSPERPYGMGGNGARFLNHMLKAGGNHARPTPAELSDIVED